MRRASESVMAFLYVVTKRKDTETAKIAGLSSIFL